MNIPSHIINAIHALYNNCTATINLNNAAAGDIPIRTGIEQGCPLSGSIFAIAVDPLLRVIVLRCTFRNITLTALADDIGIVLANIFLQLPPVLHLSTNRRPLQRWASTLASASSSLFGFTFEAPLKTGLTMLFHTSECAKFRKKLNTLGFDADRVHPATSGPTTQPPS